MKEYSLTWIFPPVRNINFEPLALGAGQANELVTLAIDPNPPTPRHSGESVMSDGKWKISFEGTPEDISALTENAGKKATLVLHGLAGSGSVTIKTIIPSIGPAFQAVTDTCSDASFEFVGGLTTCTPVKGMELMDIKVCSGFPNVCGEPEPTNKGAIWHLSRPDHEEPLKERYYRLVCKYKKPGSEREEPDVIQDHGLSLKMTECDETLKPLRVYCW